MVAMVIYSAMQLSSEALTPIVGMASGVIMALISMIGGITGTKDKEEKPEFQVIKDLIQRLDQKEAPMRVDVEDGRVTVHKGDDTVNMRG
jgi:diaminopimelate decarboxylase